MPKLPKPTRSSSRASRGRLRRHNTEPAPVAVPPVADLSDVDERQLLCEQVIAANQRIQDLQDALDNRPPPAAAWGGSSPPVPVRFASQLSAQEPTRQQQPVPIPLPIHQVPPPNVGPLGYQLPPAGPPNNPAHEQPAALHPTYEQPAALHNSLGDIQQTILNASSGIYEPPGNQNELGAGLSRFFTLGATLDMRLKARIWTGQYIDLPSLISIVGRHSLTVNLDNGAPSLSLASPRTAPVEHIWAWLRLFATYAAVYTERQPQAAPGLFTYAVRILDLQRRYKGYMWRTYDERFRSLKAYCPQLPWHVINWDLANELIGEIQTLTTTPSNNRNDEASAP